MDNRGTDWSFKFLLRSGIYDKFLPKCRWEFFLRQNFAIMIDMSGNIAIIQCFCGSVSRLTLKYQFRRIKYPFSLPISDQSRIRVKMERRKLISRLEAVIESPEESKGGDFSRGDVNDESWTGGSSEQMPKNGNSWIKLNLHWNFFVWITTPCTHFLSDQFNIKLIN